MKPETQEALRSEFERQGLKPIDDDIFGVIELPDSDFSDAGTLAAEAKKIAQEHPKLFRQRDWTALSSKDYERQESDFRERLRQEPKPGPSEFKDLDAALLSPEQEGALRRYLSGRAGNFDKSILKAALAEQKRLLGGAA